MINNTLYYKNETLGNKNEIVIIKKILKYNNECFREITEDEIVYTEEQLADKKVLTNRIKKYQMSKEDYEEYLNLLNKLEQINSNRIKKFEKYYEKVSKCKNENLKSYYKLLNNHCIKLKYKIILVKKLLGNYQIKINKSEQRLKRCLDYLMQNQYKKSRQMIEKETYLYYIRGRLIPNLKYFTDETHKFDEPDEKTLKMKMERQIEQNILKSLNMKRKKTWFY